jgi:hypothetical protein
VALGGMWMRSNVCTHKGAVGVLQLVRPRRSMDIYTFCGGFGRKNRIVPGMTVLVPWPPEVVICVNYNRRGRTIAVGHTKHAVKQLP